MKGLKVGSGTLPLPWEFVTAFLYLTECLHEKEKPYFTVGVVELVLSNLIQRGRPDLMGALPSFLRSLFFQACFFQACFAQNIEVFAGARQPDLR